MPLKFDLSGLNQPPLYHQQPLHHQPPLHPPPPSQQQLTFTIGSFSNPHVGLVRRFAAPMLQRLGMTAKPFDETKCQLAEDDVNDQYRIKKGNNICWAVLFKNDTGNLHPRSLLGNFGHAERLPAWIHMAAGLAFGVYAAIRPTVITTEHTSAETWTTLAAAAACFCFLSSTVYHVTSPSEKLAFFTRQLDYTGIYVAIAIGSIADYAIATRSFENVSFLSIADGPIAAFLTCVFFLARRGLLPSADTWSSYLGGCTVSLGLFRRMHIDKAHTGTRQATSFLLAISYFVTTPSLFRTIGNENAFIVFGLEIGCLLVVLLGMAIDNTFSWPDSLLSKGKGPSFLVCKPCGCIGTAHSIWHALSVIAAVKGAVGRELALSWQ